MKTPPESRRGWMPWAVGWGAVAAALGVFLLVSDTPDEIGEAIAAREAAGKHAQPEQTMALALWWGALANVPLALLMAAGAKLWARALPAPKGGANWREGTRAAWLAIGVIAVLAGGLRWNLAGRSLWWDELWSAQHAVVGYYLGKPDDPVDGRYFAKPSPARAMWFYTKPTNHAVASVPAQLSHRIWRAATKPARPELFSDRALRFPTWLASIGAVLAVGWLGVRWGGPWAGVCAALLLAGHPWHIRMGVDMRAYSYLVLWAALGCAVLTRLLDKRHGASWGAWWAFGAVQFLLVWSFLHATPVALAFFAVAAFAIPRNWQPREARLTAFSRLVAVNVAAAMAYLFLFAPNVAQMPVWVPKELDRNHGHSLTAGRALETATDLFTGMPLKLAEMRETRGLADFASRPAALRWVAGVLFAGAALAGAWWLWKRRRDWAWSVFGLFLAAAGVSAALWWTQGYYYSRFVVYLLAPVSLLIGLAAGALIGEEKKGRHWRVGAVTAAFAAYFALVMPAIGNLRERPYAPLRDLANLFAETRARAPEAVCAVYGHGGETMPTYDPRMRQAFSRAELEALMAEARGKGAPLLVAYGHGTFNRAQVPDGFALLDDEALFRETRVLDGIEPDFCFRVLAYRGSPGG